MNERCTTLGTAKDLMIVILFFKVHCLMRLNFKMCSNFNNMLAKKFILLKIFIVQKISTKYFHVFVIKINNKKQSIALKSSD